MTSDRKKWVIRAKRTNRKARDKMGLDGLNWYLVFVVSQKEFLAQELLAQWGAYVFLPLKQKFQKISRYRNSKELTSSAAIPGALIVGLEGNPNWYSLFELNVVYGVLRVNQEPAEMDGRELRRFIRDNQFVFSNWDASELKLITPDKGDKAEILAGPLQGRIIDVQEVKGGFAYFVYNLLGKEINARIELDIVGKFS